MARPRLGDQPMTPAQRSARRRQMSAERVLRLKQAILARDQELARLRASFLTFIQADNACPQTGAPCREPAQCGCAVEMDHAVTMATPPPG
jgi:hypothetical protein